LLIFLTQQSYERVTFVPTQLKLDQHHEGSTMATQRPPQTDISAARLSTGNGTPVDVPAHAATDAEQTVNLTGRSVFVVETTDQGVMVRSAFMTEDKRLLDMPAVFPELTYAMNVINDLQRQVTEHFNQAAQVGARVIAQQARAQQVANQAASEQSVANDAATHVVTSNTESTKGNGQASLQASRQTNGAVDKT
jgi:hypothetical protein